MTDQRETGSAAAWAQVLLKRQPAYEPETVAVMLSPPELDAIVSLLEAHAALLARAEAAEEREKGLRQLLIARGYDNDAAIDTGLRRLASRSNTERGRA